MYGRLVQELNICTVLYITQGISHGQTEKPKGVLVVKPQESPIESLAESINWYNI